MLFRKNLTNIKLTENIILAIRAEKARTCVDISKLLKNSIDTPSGLTRDIVYSWLKGNTKTASGKNLNFIFKSYGALPSDEWVPLTKDIIDKLRFEIKKTDVSPEKFHKNTPRQPKNFYSTMLNNWIGARVQHVRKSDLDFILKQYASYPTRKIALSQAMQREVEQELARTDMQSIAFLIDHPEKPKYLTSKITFDILNGNLQWCYVDHWKFIMGRLSEYPKAKTKILSDEDREIFTGLLKRKRMSYKALNAAFKEGRKYKYAEKYLRNVGEGRQEKIAEHAWNEIMAYLDKLPDRRSSAAMKATWHSRRIKITDEMHAQLNSQLDRTNASLVALVLMCPAEITTLTAGKISSWRKGKIKLAYESEWIYLMNVLNSLPSRKP